MTRIPHRLQLGDVENLARAAGLSWRDVLDTGPQGAGGFNGKRETCLGSVQVIPIEIA